ncbi:MAG TPA: ABC transporter permease [Nitriliruptorales bacterium]|nr:ABC transporter permease [Nitriliruptorales bacterium]
MATAQRALPAEAPATARALRVITRPLAPFEELAHQARFWGRALRGMPVALVKYRRLILEMISDVVVGVGAFVVGGGLLFVIATMSFFTGTQVGLEGVAGLRTIGAEAYVGLVSMWANTREITPLIAGLALAAKVGAGFTAELGAMRISEEVDACEVMGVPSIPYMVSTRLWAALVPTVPLYLLALFSSYQATRIMVTRFFSVSTGAYDQYFDLFLPPVDVVYSLLKAVLFVIVVILIHTYYGYHAQGGPAGVGVAVGRAIRASIVTVVVLNMFISVLLWGVGGETVKIAG